MKRTAGDVGQKTSRYCTGLSELKGDFFFFKSISIYSTSISVYMYVYIYLSVYIYRYRYTVYRYTHTHTSTLTGKIRHMQTAKQHFHIVTDSFSAKKTTHPSTILLRILEMFYCPRFLTLRTVTVELLKVLSTLHPSRPPAVPS